MEHDDTGLSSACFQTWPFKRFQHCCNGACTMPIRHNPASWLALHALEFGNVLFCMWRPYSWSVFNDRSDERLVCVCFSLKWAEVSVPLYECTYAVGLFFALLSTCTLKFNLLSMCTPKYLAFPWAISLDGQQIADLTRALCRATGKGGDSQALVLSGQASTAVFVSATVLLGFISAISNISVYHTLCYQLMPRIVLKQRIWNEIVKTSGDVGEIRGEVGGAGERPVCRIACDGGAGVYIEACSYHKLNWVHFACQFKCIFTFHSQDATLAFSYIVNIMFIYTRRM